MSEVYDEESLAIAVGIINKKINKLGDVLNWVGITTTVLTDGSTTNPITINGESYTAKVGDVVQYGTTEFAFGKDNKWQNINLQVEVVDGCLNFN